MKNHTLAEDSFDVRRTRSQTSRPSPVLPLIAATLFAIHPVQGQVPQITAPPRSQTISAGSNLILGAATTGGNLSYQWRVNGANIPGQTNALLFLPQPTTNNSGSYTLVVTNAAGAITSSVANVTINPLSAPRAVVVWGAGSQGQSGPSDFGSAYCRIT